MHYYQTTFFWLFVAFYFIHEVLHIVLELLNYRHAKQQDDTPQDYQHYITPAVFQRAKAYTLEKTIFSITAHLALIPFFWLLIVRDGFNVLDAYAGLWGGVGTLTQSVLFCAFVAIYFGVITLPFKIYSVFVIEQKYGFNHTTPLLFLIDLVKSLAMSASLGAPLLYVVFWLMRASADYWWLLVWLTVLIFQLGMTAVYPVLLAPLFNKFVPLGDGELKDKLLALAKKIAFKVSGVFVIDGSRRSSHSNAYFSGLGRFRRIVLFDTLIEQLTEDELVAVIAHEMGHNVKKHIRNFMILMGALSLIGFFVLSKLLVWPEFYAAFNINVPSTHAALVIFALASDVFTFMLTPLINGLSRKQEYEADAFCVQTTGLPGAMKNALLKLTRDNLSNITPHPAYSFYHYSHPTLTERLKHIDIIEKRHP